MEREISERFPESMHLDATSLRGDSDSGNRPCTDYRLDLGEVGSVSVPANVLLPYVCQAIRLMRDDEVLRITSGSGIPDVGIVFKTMNSSMPGWCWSKDHVLLASIVPDGALCFYKRRRASRAMPGAHLMISSILHPDWNDG